MKKLFVAIAVLGLTMVVVHTGLCQEKDQPVQIERNDSGWGHGPRMGYG